MQLAQLQPNKRTVVYLKEAAPVFASVAVHLSREGFKVRALTRSELNQTESWLEAAQKDLLFVLTAYDDPVTGELFEVPALEGALADKKCYRIHISHSRHTCIAPTAPQNLEAHILSLTPERAVAILGDRVKVSPPIASALVWPEVSTEEAKEQLAIARNKDLARLAQAVEAFEAAPPKGAERLLNAATPRLPDRAIIAFRDVDGLAMMTALAKELGVSCPRPGERGLLETTSLCRWQDERILQSLLARNLAPEALRGTLILDVELLARADLRATIETVYSRTLQRQSGL